MNYLTRTLSITRALGMGLGLVAAASACGGAPASAPTSEIGANGSASVGITLHLPKVGNPKYDAFFGDVADLSTLVENARIVLEHAPAALNAAANVAADTDFASALRNIGGRLKGKVTVTIALSPTGGEASVVAVPGVELSVEEQTMADAYRKVATDLATLPLTLEPVVPKSLAIGKEAVVLVASAKADFTGIKGLTTLPFVVAGLGRVIGAMSEIQRDVPAMIEQSKAMTIALKGDM